MDDAARRAWARAAAGPRGHGTAVRGTPGGLAGSPAQDAEERLDIRVGPEVPVAVEVGAITGGAARAPQAGEEGLDVGVGPEVAIVVEVRRAAGGGHGDLYRV